MEEVRLDLFKLHDGNDKGIGRIRVVLNQNLKTELRTIFKEIQKTGTKVDEISKYVGLAQSNEIYSYIDRWNIPITILNKLINLWSKRTNKDEELKRLEITDMITGLSCGSGINYTAVKCPKKLTQNLAKISGAIIADGNLTLRKTNSGDQESRITLKDGYKDSVELFSECLEKEFNIKLIPKKDAKSNCWIISFTNKIIFRYFTKLFDIETGKKSYIVKLPDIIRDSDLTYQIEFFKSVAMFDGCVHAMSGYFEFNCMSKQLTEDFEEVLKKCDIMPDYVKFNNNGRSFLKIRLKEKLEKFLPLFIEPNTIKWGQLNAHINGFGNNFDSLENALATLDTLYPRKRNGTISFVDVINSLNGGSSLEKLRIQLGKNKSTMSRFLEKLEGWEIIKSQKIPLGHGWFYKVWSLNPNLKTSNGGERNS